MPKKNETKTESKSTKKTIKLNKFMKQETYKSKSGHDYLLTYPSTFDVQRKVFDASLLDNGTRSMPIFYQALMTNILEGNEYDYAFFDKFIKEADKHEEIEVEDFDGKKTTFKFNFPSLAKVAEMMENSTAINGNIIKSEWYKQLMDNAITVGDDDTKIEYKYWDHHEGYSAVMDEADAFVSTLFYNSEFIEVITAANEFVEKMFR